MALSVVKGREKKKRKGPSPAVGLEPTQIADRATEAYDRLCERYERTGIPVNFDFREHCIEWTARADHLTHRLHRYPGRLTPYIPLFFLAVRGVAVPKGRLLDPFAGCGTVLVEAPVHPSHPMYPVGLEINPLARLIAKVKTTPLEEVSVVAAWQRICDRYRRDDSRAGLPQFPNKRHWFSKPVDQRLARVIRALEGLRDPNLRDFFLVAASATVRQVSLADPSVAVPVIIDPSRFSKKDVKKRKQADLDRRRDADVFAIFESNVLQNLARVRAWSEASALELDATIRGADARTFATAEYLEAGKLGDAGSQTIGNVDLVLTSPPYANAQRYTRSLRLEMFALGFTKDGVEERVLDKMQVGTERVPELDWEAMVEPTGVDEADDAIAAVSKKDAYRAAIVGRYVRDMETVVGNCFRALKKGGHAIFVVGNNCVRGEVLDNAKILVEIGERAGFTDVLRVTNRIPSRGLLTKRHPTAGVITHEHVIVLKKTTSGTSSRRV